jgi:hypothetical protein
MRISRIWSANQPLCAAELLDWRSKVTRFQRNVLRSATYLAVSDRYWRSPAGEREALDSALSGSHPNRKDLKALPSQSAKQFKAFNTKASEESLETKPGYTIGMFEP